MSSAPTIPESAHYCNACNIALLDDADVRAHYSSALHAVNLKRRVADIAPLSAATFARLSAEQVAADRAREAAAEEVLYLCDACRKKFHSEGQFNAHNASKRHRDAVRQLLDERAAAAEAAAAAAEGGAAASKENSAALGGPVAPPSRLQAPGSAAAPGPDEPAVGPGELIITSSHCVFCWQAQPDGVEGCLRHMQLAHSFFVPDLEFCDDPEGLVGYLHAKVIEGRMCLYCDSGKQFESPDAARQHMRDKGHCFMRYDREEHFEEFEQFFDYSGQDDEDGAGAGGGEGEGGGDDEGDGGSGGDDEAPADLQLAVGRGDAYISKSGELVLPNGTTAQPRALVRYYKQHFRLADERASVRAAMSRLALDNAAAGGGGNNCDGSRLVASSAGRAALAVRGNNVDRRAQIKRQQRQSHFNLRTGQNMNMIIRRWFRVRILE